MQVNPREAAKKTIQDKMRKVEVMGLLQEIQDLRLQIEAKYAKLDNILFSVKESSDDLINQGSPLFDTGVLDESNMSSEEILGIKIKTFDNTAVDMNYELNYLVPIDNNIRGDESLEVRQISKHINNKKIQKSQAQVNKVI